MKLRKKLMLLEEFDAQSNAKVNTEVKAEVKTETKTGEAIRTEVIADVDAILTNLETLSAQMSEGNVTLNESFDDLMKIIMSTAMYGKAKNMLGEFKKLAADADQNLLDGNIANKTEGILKSKMKLKLAKEKAKGPQKEKITTELDKLSAQEDKITAYKEKTKAKADDVLTAFNTKYSKVEGQVTGKLKELLAAEKAQIVSDVKQAGLKSKAEQLIKVGEKERAVKAKAELEQLMADRKAIDDKIAKGEDVAADDIAELKGMEPFMAEIEAFTKARTEVNKVEAEITSAVPQYNLGESLGIDQTLSFLIETEILNLFTKAKGDEDKQEAKKNLETAKKLAAAVKKASAEEWKAKKALHDKVAAAPKVTTKSLITLAGGDADAAQEVDGGYKLGALIPKWGGEEGFISAEEFSPIKKALEVENGVDQAIADAEKGGSTNENDPKSAEDLAKEKLGDSFNDYTKLASEADFPGNAGTEEAPKDKYEDKQGPFQGIDAEGKPEGEPVFYAKEIESNNDTDESKTVEEVAKEAIGDGFPGDFKGPLTKEEVDEMVPVTGEDGNDTEKAKYKDKQGPFKAKDAEGNDTGEDTYWAKLDDSSSAATVSGTDVSEAVNASGYIKAGKLGYNDQFLGRQSLAATLSLELGLNPKDKFGGGDWLGFDHVSLYATGGKNGGTILDDALTGKYTYDELKAAAAEFLGIKEAEEVEEVEEGNQFGAARAEAIAKGEKTFKVGDEEYPVEDVSKEDEENAEEFVEEAKELPKTIKLDEGLTIAQKFARLM